MIFTLIIIFSHSHEQGILYWVTPMLKEKNESNFKGVSWKTRSL
jgi:hypothetical protein